MGLFSEEYGISLWVYLENDLINPGCPNIFFINQSNSLE